MRSNRSADQLISRKQLKTRPVTKMEDGERDHEKKKHRTTKRARDKNDEGYDRIDPLTSFKKIHSKQDDDLALGASSSFDDSISPATKAGMFEFPWLKEEYSTTMKSEWLLEDAFASSLDAATNVSEILEADEALIVTGNCGSPAVEATAKTTAVASVGGGGSCAANSRKGNEEEDDGGLECVWDSLLNEPPLSNIEFEAAGF